MPTIAALAGMARARVLLLEGGQTILCRFVNFRPSTLLAVNQFRRPKWSGETLSSHESFLGSAVAALYERRILIVFVESAASMMSEMSVALSRFCLNSEQP